jgi:hypothetical protein
LYPFSFLLGLIRQEVKFSKKEKQKKETRQESQLSNQEKTLIGSGAAMGAGCRT